MSTPSLTVTSADAGAGKVSLETLAKMTGFPVEMIKEEIFMGQENAEVSLDDLRSAMLSYIDKTMLLVSEDT